jgi:hypothetical protein
LRKMMVLASGVAVVLAAAAPALAQSGSANKSGNLVDIGGGRKMYMVRGARGQELQLYFARPCADLAGDQNRPPYRRDVISGISASDGRRPRTI